MLNAVICAVPVKSSFEKVIRLNCVEIRCSRFVLDLSYERLREVVMDVGKLFVHGGHRMHVSGGCLRCSSSYF